MAVAAAAGVLVLATFAAYWPALQAGFIWDDDSYVTENVMLRSLGGLRRIWLERGATPQYYPVTHSTFWIEYQLWGLAPGGYHAVNVLLHSANALLVFRVLRRLAIPGAFLAASIFALHPIHVESVAWITERKNVLSAFFYLLAAGVYVRVFALDGSPTPGRTGGGLEILGAVFFACALLAKTVAVTLPFALGLLIVWKRKRISAGELAALGSVLVLGVLLSLQTAYLEKVHVGAVGPEWDLSLADRILVAGRALWFYLAKLVWPADLAFIYPRWSLHPASTGQWLFPATVVVAGIGLIFARPKIGSGPLVAGLFYASALAPALGLFDVYPMRYSFVANHFAYLATIGPIALATAGATAAAQRAGSAARRALVVLAGAYLVVLAALTARECLSYRDLPTLWQETIARNPECWMCENNLASVFLEGGHADLAAQHYQRALALKPDHVGAMTGLGGALMLEGRVDEAIAQFESVLESYPNSHEAQAAIGTALVSKGLVEPGIAHLEEAVRLAPQFAVAQLNLGVALAGAGRPDEAILHLTEAVRLRPSWSAAESALARARASVPAPR